MFVKYNNVFFFTATNYQWNTLLSDDKHKNIILSTLQFLVKENRVKVFGYVIMPNHLHIIWHLSEGQTKNSTQGSLLRFTAQQIKFEMIKNNSKDLNKCKVSAKDREYQIWERNPLSIEIFSDKLFEQKLNYIHFNPISEKWKLANTPEEYLFSSAKYYQTGIDDFGIISNPYFQ